MHDSLREGSRDLFRRLQQRQHELWVYTSSYRSRWYVRALLRAYGARLGGVVNGHEHDALVQREGLAERWGKHPLRFGIELLVENSPTVAQQVRAQGGAVLLVDPDDARWTESVLRASSGR